MTDRTDSSDNGTWTVHNYIHKIVSTKQFLSLRDTHEIFHYENGVYKTGGENVIDEMIKGYGRRTTIQMRNEIMDKIRAYTYIDRINFDRSPNTINVTNGLYNITAWQLYEHVPNYFSRVQLATDYNPNAKCEEFDAFLEGILHSERDRNVVLGMFGAVLVERSVNLEKILMLVGKGRNGKSMLLNVMTAVFGKNNCSFVPLEELGSNRFAIAELDGKIANICQDVTEEEISECSIIKPLISGNTMTAERKMQPPFNFENHAKFFFTGNQYPSNLKEFPAMYSRLEIVEFSTSFSDTDPHLLERLTTDEERSGILNRLIEHAGALIGKSR